MRTNIIARTESPSWYELRISINRGPEPYITSSRMFIGDIRRHVFLFTVNESPQFINLDAPRIQLAENPVLKLTRYVSGFYHKTHHSLLRYAGHADRRANGASLKDAGQDVYA